jgi:hypothetical protein
VGRWVYGGRVRGVPWWGVLSAAGAPVLLVWFGVELSVGGGLTGLAERMLAGAQALWPLAVIFTCYRSRPGHADE